MPGHQVSDINDTTKVNMSSSSIVVVIITTNRWQMPMHGILEWDAGVSVHHRCPHALAIVGWLGKSGSPWRLTWTDSVVNLSMCAERKISIYFFVYAQKSLNWLELNISRFVVSNRDLSHKSALFLRHANTQICRVDYSFSYQSCAEFCRVKYLVRWNCGLWSLVNT